MIYVIIYLVIGIINGGFALWLYNKYLKEESGRMDIWHIVGIILGAIAWPIMNIWAFIVRYKNG